MASRWNDRQPTDQGNDAAPLFVRFKLTDTLVEPPSDPEDPPSSAPASIMASRGDGEIYALTETAFTVWDTTRRHFGLVDESGVAQFSPENQRWEITEFNGDLIRHGKVQTSAITAGGTGTVLIQYNDSGTETDTAVSVTVKNLTSSEFAVDDVVHIAYEPKSKRWYIIGGGSGGTDTTQWVYIDDSVTIDEGTSVAPFSRCLWSGKKLTIEATAATFCSGADRYTNSTNVWVLSVDALNGSGSAGPRLYKGDRYLGKLVGVYDISGDARPLYAIRKGTQHDIVRVVGESSEAVTGGNVTPHVGGVWNGEVLNVTVGATNFVGGATPYYSGPACWILAPDLPGGSVDSTARLKHNDRHPAIYLGEFDNGEGARPLYAIRMTTHFGWIKFKLSYALDRTQASQIATVVDYWGTKSPAAGPLTVWNLEKNAAGTYLFQGRANAVGYAVWDEKLARYRIVVLEDDDKEAHHGCRRVTGTSITGGAGATGLSFSDVDGLIGMTNKTTSPNGLTATKAGNYLLSFNASVVMTSPSGTADGGGVVATLWRNGSAMSHDPLNTVNVFSIGGTAIKQCMAITHISYLEVGDYVSVSMFSTVSDVLVTAGLSAVWLSPTDGAPAAGGSSLPPSPGGGAPSPQDADSDDLGEQIINDLYHGE